MANNRRIYYAIQAVGMAADGTNAYTSMHGVQSIGVNPSFNLQQVSELGQVSPYQLVEMLPAVEVSLNKCFDGYPPLWIQATKGSPNSSLQGRWNQTTTLALDVFSDTQQSASGTPISQVTMSGLYPSNVTLSFLVEGTSNESLTLVGNNVVSSTGTITYTPSFLNTDVPFALTSGSGGIQRRRDVIFYPILSDASGAASNYPATKENGTALDANGQLIAFLTILPPDVFGISSSGTNDRDSAGNFSAHVQDISITCNLNREDLFELGRQNTYYKFASTPVEVTCDITVTASNSENITALAEGSLTGLNQGFNLVNRTIKVRLREGLFVDLGTTNKLSTVTYGGGDATGGNATTKYSFLTYNNFTVTHPQDPTAGIVWPY